MPQDAKLTISRTTSNQQEEDFISIYINVGKQRHRIELSLKDYALAISGMSRVPCQYEVNVIGGDSQKDQEAAIAQGGE